MTKKIANKSINIDEFKQHEKDTGSVEIQIAMLTDKIQRLTDHFKSFPKDFASKRGLIQMVAQRRKSLQYIERKEPEQYNKIIQRLGIRG